MKINILDINSKEKGGKETSKSLSFSMDSKDVEECHTETELDRFLDAHKKYYKYALYELTNGQKRSLWIWFIFPQQKGLGNSYNSLFYDLDGLGEAQAYLAHPVLGERLHECCRALPLHKEKGFQEIMGSRIDVIKQQTSMNLFNLVEPAGIFKTVLDTFF